MLRLLPSCLACFHVFWLLCFVRAEICVDSHHRITTVQGVKQALNQKEFRRGDSGNYTNILLDVSNDRLIVGGRNYVFFLSASNLTEVVAIRWKSDQKYDQCIARGLEQRECENYIQYVGLVDDRLFVCGTNSGSPSYNISSVTAPSQAYFSRNMLYGVCATPHPDLRMVGSVTRYGELIAGTYRDIGGKVGVIAATYLTESMPRVQLSTDRWTKPSLFDPKFVASVDVGDSVYIFFNEQAPELGGIVAPSVARICKTDNGAPQIVSSNLFTTFRKTRLQCTVDEISFSNIDHVAFHNESQTFYALFSTSSKILPVSAVCAFPRLQFDVVFDGPFLAKSDGQTWKVINNGAFLKGCKVNPANLTSQWRNRPALAALLPPGKEPTNYLDLVSIVQTIDYQLMSRPLVADLSVVTYVQPLVRLSRIAIESLDVFINGSVQVEEIFYIGTDSGSILVLSKGVASGKPCLIDEVRLSESRQSSERILQILVSSEQGLLFVSTSERVVSLETRACGRYNSEDECIQARDPRCGWSASKSSCISTKDRTRDFSQDLSQCPHISAQWGDWSSWFPCVQEGFGQKYCLCRRRACQSCDPSACSVGGSMEIKNCSVNNITDIDAWKITGVVDGAFSLWGEWSQCGEGNCGKDFQTRLRTCSHPEPRNGGRECGGANIECRYCHKEPELCLVHWSEWSTWSDCTKIREDIYVQTSSRNCSRGASCQGPMNQTRTCSPTGVCSILGAAATVITGCSIARRCGWLVARWKIRSTVTARSLEIVLAAMSLHRRTSSTTRWRHCAERQVMVYDLRCEI